MSVSVDAFEALVRAQVPASRAWRPVTDYSFQARSVIEGDHPRLIRDVLRPREVLDVGCGPGHLVRLLRGFKVEAIGCDLVPPRGAMKVDISEPIETPAQTYDVVICREVLEHLTVRQIRQAVTNLCLLSERIVYVTTRFARHPDGLLDVETSDNLDPTHISMMHPDLLRALFVLEGFRRRPEYEQALDWRHLGRCLVYERVP
jgi:SAM-dependent methyltransferase